MVDTGDHPGQVPGEYAYSRSHVLYNQNLIFSSICNIYWLDVIWNFSKRQKCPLKNSHGSSKLTVFPQLPPFHASITESVKSLTDVLHKCINMAKYEPAELEMAQVLCQYLPRKINPSD